PGLRPPPPIPDTPGPSRRAPRIKGLAGHATGGPQNGKRRPHGRPLHGALEDPVSPLSRGTNGVTAVSDQRTVSRRKTKDGLGEWERRGPSVFTCARTWRPYASRRRRSRRVGWSR